MEIRTLDNIDYLVLSDYRIYNFYLYKDGYLSPRQSMFEEGIRFITDSTFKALALQLANDLGIDE